MNDQVKFKRLQELISALQEGMDELNIGKLSIDQLDNLTDHSRELYERLVVLRYKAFDQLSKAESAPIKVEESAPVAEVSEPTVQIEAPVMPEAAAAEEFSVPFKLSVPPNQVSLIDAIEEVTKAEEPSEPVVAAETSKSVNESMTPQESLHEKLSKIVAQSASLAQKMEHTAIPDLKRAITLNQRFQFSKELFKGNNEDYEVAIDRLNSISREEAMNQLDQLRHKYSWNNEAQVTQDFMELIERRHLQA